MKRKSLDPNNAQISFDNQVFSVYRTVDIPWIDVIAMRHRLVHAYFDIDLDIVWQALKGELPPLIAALRKVLDEAK